MTLKAAVKALLPHIRKATETFGKYGTAGGVENYEKIGNFPHPKLAGQPLAGGQSDLRRDDARHDPHGSEGLLRLPHRLRPAYRDHRRPLCAAGVRGTRIREHRHARRRMPDRRSGGRSARPTISATAIGLDTISTGATIAFAMEAYEKGIIGKADTDGVELTWGNGAALLAMIGKIARGEGIGRLMGEGSEEDGRSPREERRANSPSTSRGSNRRRTIRDGSSARPSPTGRRRGGPATMRVGAIPTRWG